MAVGVPRDQRPRGGEASGAGNIETMPERGDQNSDTGLVPGFGTWRNIYTATAMRTGWNRLALLLADTMSGFNAFVRNAVQMIVTVPKASFATVIAATSGGIRLAQ